MVHSIVCLGFNPQLVASCSILSRNIGREPATPSNLGVELWFLLGIVGAMVHIAPQVAGTNKGWVGEGSVELSEKPEDNVVSEDSYQYEYK